ncbi:segregation and condensation protein A [Glaciecola punicea]|jgi:segregation and condensation protein A|uniref:segregation and condensation protein A n=1 Tax=Glaciecola punicea TaxID=56804 RepID=UPI000871EDBE|nr:ScpA family protein [Glaciecola punicea]OFA29757.1 segregation and condensation protein A [Glaciecola punicea]
MNGSKDKSKITEQQPLALAFINGEAFIDKPEDLYIPPDALELILDTFEGPLDLLLYLIRKQKFDIIELPVLQVTRQYMEYVEVMTTVKLELAGEYLVMAAMLAEIKSRLLLPKHDSVNDDEDDPRAELVRRLKQYEQIKAAAFELDNSVRLKRDFFVASADTSDNVQPIKNVPQVQLQELTMAFLGAIKRANAYSHHHIAREVLSTRERMSMVLHKLNSHTYIALSELLSINEGRAGIVVTFIAILELVKESLIVFEQGEPFGDLHVKLGTYEQD